MTDELGYYSTHGAITEPCAYVSMFDGAPDDGFDFTVGLP